MRNIDNIIQEVIKEEIASKSILSESALDDIKELLSDYQNKSNKSKEDLKKERTLKKKLAKEKRGRKKVRKTRGGGKTYYDYHDYERSHRKTNKADTDSIIDTVDQNNTDIAAVAKEVLPDHTPEGAQSQLRKILNHERPMTSNVASKLQTMISRGKVAVK